MKKGFFYYCLRSVIHLAIYLLKVGFISFLLGVRNSPCNLRCTCIRFGNWMFSNTLPHLNGNPRCSFYHDSCSKKRSYSDCLEILVSRLFSALHILQLINIVVFIVLGSIMKRRRTSYWTTGHQQRSENEPSSE